MKDALNKVFTKDGIKLPYPTPVSDHQASKNIGYAMGWRAAKKDIQSEIECEWNYNEDGEFFETSCNNDYRHFKEFLREEGILYCPFCGGKIKNE